MLQPGLSHAAGYQEHLTKRPDLFHNTTGMRISRQRAPTPDDIPPPSVRIDAKHAIRLIGQGAVLIDVFGISRSRFDELDGSWKLNKPHLTIPGATWLPEVGRGVLEPVMQAYLESNLRQLTNQDTSTPVIVFCVADCWMSWNAAQRIARLGYQNVYWLRHGIDGWADEGQKLVPATPVPVDVN